ncbi:hypothetical protein [Aquirufa rosea]|uniref:Uncharacterized protein n=1 Tax=Aquirufa rosea TaxID=2509241 RepID=A0A4Q1BZZ6_9BACT|nr:hypothetical protein [Aquirufa rosea]RXK49736.1 hypothetical protein ESB04_06055 [Aquirufa rosea]
MYSKRLRVLFFLFCSIVLTIIGKNTLEHNSTSTTKQKFRQQVSYRLSFINAFEEEESSEDAQTERIHEIDQISASRFYANFQDSQQVSQSDSCNNFCYIKSHFPALFEVHGNWRI